MGDLLPRHMQIFRSNEFFAGVILPMPDIREPLESKMPKTTTREVLDFLYKCLDRDPSKRWSCDQLIKHQYFNGFSFRIPTSEQEEFDKVRKGTAATLRSLGGNGGNSNTTGTLLPHLSNNGSPSDHQHQGTTNSMSQQQHQLQQQHHSNQQPAYKNSYSHQNRDSRESFDKLPTI